MRTGRFAPVYDEDETMTVPCEHVFLSIGQSIRVGRACWTARGWSWARGGRAVADALTYQTAEPDVFVGGDVYTGPKFAIDAIAAGKEGAVSIHRFVQPNTSLTIGRNRREFMELNKDRPCAGKLRYLCPPGGGHGRVLSTTARSFRDAHKTLYRGAGEARRPARCLGCGASVVDPNKCIGCGICTTKCEFDAIHLHRELA